MSIKFIKKRNNDIVEFNIERIKVAITKASNAVSELISDELEAIAESILIDIIDLSQKIDSNDVVSVEQVQDIVEKNLMKFGKYEIAKAYILYRQQQAEKRAQQHQEDLEKLTQHQLKVTKNDGSQQPFDMSKIKAIYDKVALDVVQDCPYDFFEEKFKSYIIDGIKTSDITKLLIKSAVDLISVENTKWQYMAARLAVSDLYKKACRNR